ncbi:MAG: repeat domain protein, partial [Labilithrix sp.]|nr:repeat domain protein [Labilithrix sp.]
VRPAIRPASRLAVACAGDPCYVAVSGDGSAHICGLLNDGSVRCWGRDTLPRADAPPAGDPPQTDGALGRGRVVSALEGATPAPVVGLSGVTQVSVGKNLGTCARTGDGSVHCWGRNEYGQLGRPETEASLPVPTRIEGLPPVSAVALGGTTGCAIASADGALWCWGSRDSQIGRATLTTPEGDSTSFPPQVMTGFRAPVRELVIATVRGNSFRPFDDTIVALLDGDILASLGQLPAGESSAPFNAPPPTPIELPRVVRGGAFGYLGSDGVLSQWVPEIRDLYVPLPHTVVDVSITAARADFGVLYIEQAGVLLSSGRLFRWGRNTAGTLGYPSDTLDVAEEPRDMTHVAGDRVVSFATTAASTCVSLVDGKVKCWGTNQRGELGRGTIDAAEHPEAEVIR